MPWLEFQKPFLRFLIKQDHDKKQNLILSILFPVWACPCLLKSISSLIRFRPFELIKQHGPTKGITSLTKPRSGKDRERVSASVCSVAGTHRRPPRHRIDISNLDWSALWTLILKECKLKMKTCWFLFSPHNLEIPLKLCPIVKLLKSRGDTEVTSYLTPSSRLSSFQS